MSLLLSTPGHSTSLMVFLYPTTLLRRVPLLHLSQISKFSGTLLQPEYGRTSSMGHLSTPPFAFSLSLLHFQIALPQPEAWLTSLRPHILSLRWTTSWFLLSEWACYYPITVPLDSGRRARWKMEPSATGLWALSGWGDVHYLTTCPKEEGFSSRLVECLEDDLSYSLSWSQTSPSSRILTLCSPFPPSLKFPPPTFQKLCWL